jgi:hypothetical protein
LRAARESLSLPKASSLSMTCVWQVGCAVESSVAWVRFRSRLALAVWSPVSRSRLSRLRRQTEFGPRI